MMLGSVLKKINQNESFNSYVNLMAICDDIAVGIDGSLTIGFTVEGFDFVLSKDEIINDSAYIGDLLLNLMNENIGLQWIYKVNNKNDEFIANYQVSSIPPKEYEYIKDNKIKALKGKNIKNIGIYLFCTINALNLSGASKNGALSKLIDFGSGLFSANPRDIANSNARMNAEKDFENIKKQLDNLENNLGFFASRLNIGLKRMNSRNLIDYYYKELNPDRSLSVDSPKMENILSESTLRSQLMFSYGEIKRDFFYIDGFYYKFINMHRLPSETNAYGLTPLLNIENLNATEASDFFPYDVSVAFGIPNQEKTINKIQSDRNIKASLTDGVGGGYTDYRGINIINQLDEFLESVSKMQKKVVNVSLSIRLKSRIAGELDLMAVKILETMKDIGGMEGIADNMEHHNLFLSFLPGHANFNRRFKTAISSAVSPFFPLHKGFSGTKSCAIPLINTRGEAVSLDLYNNTLPAKHGIIFGKTRSGKGFMLNGFLTNFYMSGENYHIVGVDIGGTYSKFCRIFNGDYIELDLDGTYCINPFPPKRYIVKIVNNEEVYDPDIMIFLTGITGLMVEPEKNLSPNDKTIIARAIQASYDKINGENDMPVFSDINNVLFDYNEGRDAEDKKRAMEMGKNLFQWTDISSPYSQLLNRKRGIDLSKKITIFDLQKLKGHEDLQKVVFAIIKNISFKKMYDKSAKVFFFYDECWEFMNDSKIAELITHLYKTSAKWGSMVWSITQEPGDILNAGSVGKSIIENSTVKIFCQLDADVSENDLKFCGINEKEIDIIKNLKVVKGHYAEYFLKFGKDTSVIRNTPDPFEYWLCCKSSEDEEVEKQFGAMYPDKSLKEILYILAEKYPNGPYGIRNIDGIKKI